MVFSEQHQAPNSGAAQGAKTAKLPFCIPSSRAFSGGETAAGKTSF